MTQTSATPQFNPAIDPLEACLRAVLAYQDQGMSSASLRSRVAHGQGLWTQDTLLEAADSLGFDSEVGEIDPALPGLPMLPALCNTHEGTVLALLAMADDASVLVVDPDRSERPMELPLADLLARLP